MNPLYDQFFNPQYVNANFLQTVQQQYHNEQIIEIEKAVKAVHDYCKAVRRIGPEYQQEAFVRCAMAAVEEMQK